MRDGRTIGARLRAARRSRGLTQEELAAAVGTSRDLIAKVEQGQRQTARLTSLIKLANALDVELSTLIGKHDQLGFDRDGGSVLGLRNVLLSPSLLPDLDDEPTPLEDIRQAVDDACASYWAGHFPTLIARLPSLITEA
ncbi:helix-turn-helix domain-containing protein [Nonomuraea sp. NPDC004702]